jgi:glycerol-3-phosphate dehydrogenase
MAEDNALAVDVLIVGGGIAGLWTLAKLKKAGYQTVLLESSALGAGQTRYAQGIIHGGTKYALTGKLTASSEAVADMPAFWRDCHAGHGELDLSSAIKLSDAHYLWSTSSLSSRISGFFASKVMRARTRSLADSVRPSLFSHPEFKGQIYQLDEPVFDTLSVVRALAAANMDSILEVDSGSYQVTATGLKVNDKTGNRYQFNYKQLVLMAGSGNETLLAQSGRSQPEMQLRPLKMVMLRGGLSDTVYAHCLGASVNPRVTITSHFDQNNNIVWYLGGQLAEEGVRRSDTEQIRQAQNELAELIPWLDLSNSEWAVLDIDRAEVRKSDGSRPDTFFAEQDGNVITAWPTKLALAPKLASDVLQKMNDSGIAPGQSQLPSWPAASFSVFPWCEAGRWSRQ